MLRCKDMKLTPHQINVVADALLLFALGYHTFTFAGFAAATGHKDNRHTRAAINALVKHDVLFKARTLFDDGHYRMTFSRQRTEPLRMVA